MNLQTVITNLKNTIAGKEMTLAEYTSRFGADDIAQNAAMYATVESLKINIDELRRILQDVESIIARVGNMNERIRELAIEARRYAESKIHLTGWNYAAEYDKKFAELIVKECAVFVENDDYRGVTLADRLKQHFGIEEFRVSVLRR